MSTNANADYQFEYSRVPYPGAADALMQIRNLETLAGIFELQPTPISKCRVLELGCADGTNLLPFAEEFPESLFVGVDLAEQRIQEAVNGAAAAGITNAAFYAANITTIGPELGQFDYILCPGVFSWVAIDEREALLRACRQLLTPNGIAAISFNVLPGWNIRGTVRDLIRHHVRVFDEPKEKIAEARRVVEFLADQTRRDTPHGMLYAQAHEHLKTATDHYVYHDYISNKNQPYFFHEFQSFLEANRLQFVSDADFSQTAATSLPNEARQTLNNTPFLQREQLLDFLQNTSYRRAVVCRSEPNVNRRIDYRSIQDLTMTLRQSFAGAHFAPTSDAPLILNYEGGSLTVVDPLGKIALKHLSDVWPTPVHVAELYEISRRQLSDSRSKHDNPDGPKNLGQSLLAAICAGVANVYRTPPKIATRLSSRPRATSFARLRAKQGGAVINQWHTTAAGLNSDERFVLSLLDGTREFTDIALAVQEWRERNPGEHIGSAIDGTTQILQHLLSDQLLLTD